MHDLTDRQLLAAALQRGIPITDASLLRQALTHKSATPDDSLACNERLEFLGDAVLSEVIALHLYATMPHHPEGALAKARSLIVCKNALAAAARRLDLTPLLHLGATEEAMGGRNRASLVADVYEALLAVISLTAGRDAARDFILRTLAPEIQAVYDSTDWRDAKTTLQELCQSHGAPLPVYDIVEEHGLPHDKTFTAQVTVTGGANAKGSGKSKKDAQQAAAQALLSAVDVATLFRK